MDSLQENVLLTSSDFEHIMENLNEDSNFLPLHVDENEILEPETLETVHTTSPTSHSPTSTIPCTDIYPGPLGFEILLDSATANRTSWVYSYKLNKIFIDMGKSLLVQFRINEMVRGLRVRALPVYSQTDHISVPVQRCDLHELNYDPYRQAHSSDGRQCFCANFDLVRHVVQSSHLMAQYDYDRDSNRHSVVVPLDIPQAGSDTVVVEYHFTCKTSCSRGMNRKPIYVIFTLETEQGDVIGRQTVSVKICSCPKRDKEKEEALEVAVANNGDNQNLNSRGKRRISSAEQRPFDKKVKIEENSQGPIAAVNNVSFNANHDNLNDVINTQFSSQKSIIVALQSEVSNLSKRLDATQCEIANMSKMLEATQNEIVNFSNRLEAKLEGIFGLVQSPTFL